MGDILQFPQMPRPNAARERFLARRERNKRKAEEKREDLTMDHADPCIMPSDSAYPSNLA